MSAEFNDMGSVPPDGWFAAAKHYWLTGEWDKRYGPVPIHPDTRVPREVRDRIGIKIDPDVTKPRKANGQPPQPRPEQPRADDELPELPAAIRDGIDMWHRAMLKRQRLPTEILELAAHDLFSLLKHSTLEYPHLADRAHQAVVDGLQAMAEAAGIRDDEAQKIMTEGKYAADNEGGAGRRSGASGNETWSDPDWSILEDRRGELPQFPVEKMATDMQQWLVDAAHGAGVTPAHVAVPLLGVVASIVGAARRVKASSSWSEPLTLWVAVVGLSGTGKTPGIDVSKRGLSSVERGRRGKIAELRRLHETASEAAMVTHKRWKDEVKSAAENGRSPPPMPVEAAKPEEFVAPRLWVSDATIERLAVLLRARPSGLLMICDELAGLFLNMGRYNDGHDHEFWLEAWNGKQFVVERMGRPPVEIEHLLIGIVGGFQPDKLVRSFERDDDGMYARMLFAWPDEPAYQRLRNDVDENDPAIHNAIAYLVRLTETASSTAETAETKNVAGFRSSCSFCSTKAVWLSEQAVKKFEAFRLLIHEKKAELDGREREWLSKGGTHVLRLAGALQYLA